jgi:hypothetical protein
MRCCAGAGRSRGGAYQMALPFRQFFWNTGNFTLPKILPLTFPCVKKQQRTKFPCKKKRAYV